MVSAKKMRHKAMLLGLATLFFVLVSCSEKLPDDNYLAEINFYNESSYSISIHQTSFSGPVLVDMLESGGDEWVKVPPSDNYGVGTMFSIVYWPRIELESGDIYINAIDPDMQISQNIEAGGSYSISIPNPDSLELTEKFLKILNASNNSFQLGYLSVVYIPTDGELSVPRGKPGFYKIDRELDYAIAQGVNIIQGIDNYYPLPNFISENGYIYNFEFDGEEVKEMGREKISFEW